MSAWWILVVDGLDVPHDRVPEGEKTAGVTRYYCGYIYHGRMEFSSKVAALAWARNEFYNGTDEVREVVDLSTGRFIPNVAIPPK